jgi:hypothetical protein
MGQAQRMKQELRSLAGQSPATQSSQREVVMLQPAMMARLSMQNTVRHRRAQTMSGKWQACHVLATAML